MSTIGGPGGIGGPKGPGGPSGPAGPDGPDGPDAAAHATGAGGVQDIGATSAAAPTGGLDAIAADLASGKLTAHEAVDKLVEQIASSSDLAPADRAELRELMTDLVANDPHLGALLGRL